MEWVVNATPRPLYPRERPGTHCIGGPGWTPGPVWRGAENLAPAGIRFPDRPARSESLYRESYRGPQYSYYMETCLKGFVGILLLIQCNVCMCDVLCFDLANYVI